jgi:ribokinase
VVEAAQRIIGQGVGTVIVTRGSQDVLVVDASGATNVGVPSVDAVDTTGAGDTFCGVFVAWFAAGLSMRAATERAVAAAAICVTRPGAIASIPSRAELVSAVSHATVPAD